MRDWLTLVVVLLLPVGFVPPERERRTAARVESIVVTQTATSAYRSGHTFRDCADCPELVVIPGGSFMMGSPTEEPGRIFLDEGPLHPVSVRQLAVGRFDVTRGEWTAFVSATNRETRGGCWWTPRSGNKPDPAASWRDPGFLQDDHHPVVCVTWDDTQAYLRWLTARTGHTYRLLSEAEWEYAARAGTTTPYPWGTTASHDFANYGADACCSALAADRDQWLYTSPTGAFPPNAFGLYDMHGNVLQWVQDCFAPSYTGLPNDGSAYETSIDLQMTDRRLAVMTGTSSCSYRMIRGADWNDPPATLRSAFRNFGPPRGATLEDYRSTGLGLRVARTLR